MEYITML